MLKKSLVNNSKHFKKHAINHLAYGNIDKDISNSNQIINIASDAIEELYIRENIYQGLINNKPYKQALDPKFSELFISRLEFNELEKSAKSLNRVIQFNDDPLIELKLRTYIHQQIHLPLNQIHLQNIKQIIALAINLADYQTLLEFSQCLAELHLAEGEYEQALKECESTFAMIKEQDDMNLEAIIGLHYIAAITYLQLGQETTAISYANDGYNLCLQFDINSAIELFYQFPLITSQSIEKIFKQKRSDFEFFITYFASALVLPVERDLSLIEQQIMQANQHVENHRNMDAISCYYEAAHIAYDQGDYETEKHCYFKAIKIVDTCKDQLTEFMNMQLIFDGLQRSHILTLNEQLDFYILYGDYLFSMGDYTQAFDNFTTAKSVYEKNLANHKLCEFFIENVERRQMKEKIQACDLMSSLNEVQQLYIQEPSTEKFSKALRIINSLDKLSDIFFNPKVVKNIKIFASSISDNLEKPSKAILDSYSPVKYYTHCNLLQRDIYASESH